jgi:hypothetical protein
MKEVVRYLYAEVVEGAEGVPHLRDLPGLLSDGLGGCGFLFNGAGSHNLRCEPAQRLDQRFGGPHGSQVTLNGRGHLEGDSIFLRQGGNMLRRHTPMKQIDDCTFGKWSVLLLLPRYGWGSDAEKYDARIKIRRERGIAPLTLAF